MRIGGPERRVVGREFDSAVEAQVADLADPAGTRRLYSDVRRPQAFPLWRRVVIDSEGWTWAEQFGARAEDPALWTVFDPEGEARGVVTVPQGLTVHQIGADFILGVWRDEDGVEHVRRHRLLRTGS
jgi:hypothetical protein